MKCIHIPNETLSGHKELGMSEVAEEEQGTRAVRHSIQYAA